MQNIITALTHKINEIECVIALNEGLLTGTPWVIQCAPGLYLVADGEGYRGGSITGGVVCYTPARIDAAVQHVRDVSAGVFDNACKVNKLDALRTELASLKDLLAETKQAA